MATASSSDDDPSRCLLLALSHDELGVIFDGLADPLQPIVAVLFSSTCKGLRTPPVLQSAQLTLTRRHCRAAKLCRKLDTSCADLSDETKIVDELCLDDMETLGMILRTRGLPKLYTLQLAGNGNGFGDAGMEALCQGLGDGGLPLLGMLNLQDDKIGPAGAEALAAALRRGAMPTIEVLDLRTNPLGNRGLAALATALRKHPALVHLTLERCELGDDGVATLLKDLGKDEFKALKTLDLDGNEMVSAASATMIVSAIDRGALPTLGKVNFRPRFTPTETEALIDAALKRRSDAASAASRGSEPGSGAEHGESDSAAS